MINQESQIYSYPISNPAFTQGFTTVISFGFSGEINFNFTIKNITNDQVNVQFDTSTNNLIYIGYQVVVGTQEAFTMTPIFNIPAYSVNATVTDPVTGITTPGTSSYYTDYIQSQKNL